MPIAELQGKIGVDVSDLDRAQNAAHQFEHDITTVFRRTGDIRATGAIEAFIAELTGGNVIGAVEALARRITGLGLLGGVAFASLSAGVAGIFHVFSESEKTVKGFNDALVRIPAAGAGLDQLKAHADELFKRVTEVHGPLTQLLTSRVAFQGPGGIVSPEIERAREATTVMAADLTRMADKQRELSENTIIEAEASGAVAESLKARVQAEEEIAKVIGERQTREQALRQAQIPEALRTQAIGAVAGGASREIDAIKERVALAGVEAEKEKELDAIKNSALPTELQAIAIEQSRIGILERIRGVIAQTNIHGREALDLAIERARAEERGQAIRLEAQQFKPLFERAQLSLSEILQQPDLRHGGSIAIANAQRVAKEAAREEAAGQQERLRGNEAGAFERFFRAEQLKSQIPILKESEKMPEFAFRAAIDGAGVFKDMVAYLAQINTAMTAGGNPFANK